MPTLYEELLEIARTYMGIAAKEYIDRRCRIAARDTPPEQLTADKLDRLVAGIKMTSRVYMSDEKARNFQTEVSALKSRT